ncbi:MULTISPECIES: hypothetical protein [Pectobacterium]|uniref:hypothetical protein n=1 Tax=Pectobacterium TaxID=122277 RepID=UPI0021C3C05E|nr:MULTISPECIES: hypothetical protein [Pectobacterium]MDY4347955.1 hypothetical protein [Pectobacterium brasiliense]
MLSPSRHILIGQIREHSGFDELATRPAKAGFFVFADKLAENHRHFIAIAVYKQKGHLGKGGLII